MCIDLRYREKRKRKRKNRDIYRRLVHSPGSSELVSGTGYATHFVTNVKRIKSILLSGGKALSLYS